MTSSILSKTFIQFKSFSDEKNLSVNPNKTIRDNVSKLESDIDAVKTRLLRKRRAKVVFYDEANEEQTKEVTLQMDLDDEEMAYLRDLLQLERLEEEDAELLLTMMRDHSDEAAPALYNIASEFPHLAKNVYQFCAHITNLEELASEILDIVKTNPCQEYQLFWFAYILEDYLMDTTLASALIDAIYTHPNATIISKAKILEIPDQRYGLIELRDENLGAGQADWLSWASAVGHRKLPSISQAHKLSYFAKSSNLNHLIYSIMA